MAAAPDAQIFTAIKHFAAAAAAPTGGNIRLGIPEIGLGAKADGPASVVFAGDS